MTKGEVNEGLRQWQERERERKAALAAEGGAAEAVEEAPVDLQDGLASVFRTIQQAQTLKSSKKALSQIMGAVSQLSEEDKDALVKTEEFQRVVRDVASTGEDRLRPGTYILDNETRKIIGKVPWTAADMLAEFPMTTWMPLETDNITALGHTIHVEAGVEITTLGIFKTIADQAREATRRQHDENMEAVATHGGGIPTFGEGWFKEELK